MATLQTLYSIQPVMEATAKAILQANGISNVITSRETGSLTTPRVELQYVVGAPNNHMILSSSLAYADQFAGTLTVMAVTDKSINEISQSNYATNIINLLGGNAYFNTASVQLPNHKVVYSKVNQINNQIIREENLDMTIISISQVVAIRYDKWPWV